MLILSFQLIYDSYSSGWLKGGLSAKADRCNIPDLGQSLVEDMENKYSLQFKIVIVR